MASPSTSRSSDASPLLAVLSPASTPDSPAAEPDSSATVSSPRRSPEHLEEPEPSGPGNEVETPKTENHKAATAPSDKTSVARNAVGTPAAGAESAAAPSKATKTSQQDTRELETKSRVLETTTEDKETNSDTEATENTAVIHAMTVRTPKENHSSKSSSVKKTKKENRQTKKDKNPVASGESRKTDSEENGSTKDRRSVGTASEQASESARKGTKRMGPAGDGGAPAEKSRDPQALSSSVSNTVIKQGAVVMVTRIPEGGGRRTARASSADAEAPEPRGGGAGKKRPRSRSSTPAPERRKPSTDKATRRKSATKNGRDNAACSTPSASDKDDENNTAEVTNVFRGSVWCSASRSQVACFCGAKAVPAVVFLFSKRVS